MTKEEAIRVLCSMDVPEGNKTLIDKDSHEALTMAIDALSKPSLPSNLDEAARAYSRVVINGEERFIQNDKYAFKAGAEWMAWQGVSMEINDETEWADVDSFVRKNVDGKAILQIRKKQ